MKKVIFTALLVVITSVIFAQSQNVTSAAIILKQYNSEKDKSVKVLKIKEAKEFIDKAYNNESTSNKPKMWMYRAQIYKMIALNHDSLDSEAVFKATESHLKCMQPHPKKKNKIMIYKKWPKEEVLEGLVQCGDKLFRLGVEEYTLGKYKSSLKHYTAIFDIIPFDEEDQLKRANITRATILYNSFFSSNKMKDNTKSKELLKQLIDINFNEPNIYIHMSNIFIEEGNTDKALEYLALGRDMFEDDQGLINTEINLYIQLGRTSELIGKLGEAIALDDENDLLYFNRGTIYDQEGDLANAEKDYLTALDLNPSSFGVNYNLGALYFNVGVKTNNKANGTSNNSVYNKLKKEAEVSFVKALPYLETAHELKPEDKNTLLSLKQLYYLNGDYAKSEEMKKRIAELK
ncbi:MAG: tetratricopeptide repeat protein [Bacteroidota bacterium]|nr:tetratricopeptide repeat protein [Bacteroidota bacterium]